MKNKFSQKSFSLLEMMIAVVILGVGVASVLNGISGTMEANRRVEERRIAAQLLHAKLTEYENLAQPMEALNGTFSAPHESYHWRVEALPTELPGLIKVEAEISWPGRGIARHLKTQTLAPQR